MRKLSFRAKASIAILMAVMLIANANLAFADDRGDRRGGKFDKPGFTRHSDRGGRGHYSNRAQRNDGRRDGDNRRNNRRDNHFDGGSFFGGVVVGSILSANQAGVNRHYAGNSHNTLHYGGYFDRRLDARRRTNFRHPSHYSSFGYSVSPLLSSLLIDLEGNCFDVSRDSLGNEVRLQLEPAQCGL
ncbi:MAG: hypothetical protein ABS30_01920 [OM182 bacterium BACL3 MAG-120924-bin41]|uniref:Secreted protein n=1 Tax=OM182 bacterium BACL3 MAG-120924-bin41 TaxID=1655632 RepID=A0A0R2X213_9GAMM|nr:MAG: hypothetical protein ABS30_01920 [OM182 bacterium BACL3 MAG-120924-bin41]